VRSASGAPSDVAGTYPRNPLAFIAPTPGRLRLCAGADGETRMLGERVIEDPVGALPRPVAHGRGRSYRHRVIPGKIRHLPPGTRRCIPTTSRPAVPRRRPPDPTMAENSRRDQHRSGALVNQCAATFHHADPQKNPRYNSVRSSTKAPVDESARKGGSQSVGPATTVGLEVIHLVANMAASPIQDDRVVVEYLRRPWCESSSPRIIGALLPGPSPRAEALVSRWLNESGRCRSASTLTKDQRSR
jgi:hypothetical protein